MHGAMLGMQGSLYDAPISPVRFHAALQTCSSFLRQGALLSAYLREIMCSRARLRRLYLRVPPELRPSPLQTRVLDTVHAVRRAMSVVMSSSNLPSPLWIGESSTSISVLYSITNFWADMHSTSVRFALLEPPQMRSSLQISLWRTMRRSALYRVCIRGRKGACGGRNHELHDCQSRPGLRRTR